MVCPLTASPGQCSTRTDEPTSTRETAFITGGTTTRMQSMSPTLGSPGTLASGGSVASKRHNALETQFSRGLYPSKIQNIFQ